MASPDVSLLTIMAAVLAISCAPTAAASPTSPLCDSGSYRRAHPLICDTGGPFNVGAGSGGPQGGGGGGLLDVIGDALGHLGGIL